MNRTQRMYRVILLLAIYITGLGCYAESTNSDSSVLDIGFESQPTGTLKRITVDNGWLISTKGKSEIVAGKQRTGKHSLRMYDYDSIVSWEPQAIDSDAYELSFWAERWTKNGPFEFRVEFFDGTSWREVYRGDDDIEPGGYKTRVIIPLNGVIPERIRFVCRSDPNKGVLIDDIRITRSMPMAVESVVSEPTGMPVLVGNRHNPVVRICLNTPGNIDKLHLNRINLELSEESTSSISAIEVFGTGGISSLDWRNPNTVFDDAIAIGTSTPPARTLTFESDYALDDGKNYFWVSYQINDSASLSHIPLIQCREVMLSNGDAIALEGNTDSAQATASKRVGIALRNTREDDVAAYRIPGLATTNNGTLIAVYDVRYNSWSDLPANIDIGMSRSTDGGISWEPMKIIGDMGYDPKWSYDGIGDPAVLVDRETGTIWVAGLWSHGERGWKGSGAGLSPDETGQLVLFKSDDDGRTWSEPINITSQIKDPKWHLVFNGPGCGISKRDGTIVFAGQFKDADDMPYSTIIYSKDHGITWHIGSGAKSNTTEAQVAELSDGSLMLNMRDNRGESRSVYITNDLGQTWHEHPTSRSALPEPVCQASLISMDVPELSRPILLFSNPAVPDKPRRNMTIKVSLDDGNTWPEEYHLLIDSGTSAGYSCLTAIDPHTVGILYEGSRANMTFLRIPLKDILGNPQP